MSCANLRKLVFSTRGFKTCFATKSSTRFQFCRLSPDRLRRHSRGCPVLASTGPSRQHTFLLNFSLWRLHFRRSWESTRAARAWCSPERKHS